MLDIEAAQLQCRWWLTCIFSFNRLASELTLVIECAALFTLWASYSAFTMISLSLRRIAGSGATERRRFVRNLVLERKTFSLSSECELNQGRFCWLMRRCQHRKTLMHVRHLKRKLARLTCRLVLAKTLHRDWKIIYFRHTSGEKSFTSSSSRSENESSQ